MKRDEIYRGLVRGAIDSGLSSIDERPSLWPDIQEKIKGEKKMKKKISTALVFALAAMLALTGAALATGLDVFGQVREKMADEISYERLGLLEETAATVGRTFRFAAPAAVDAQEPQNDRERLMLAQHDFTADLTIDQIYCDGRKLYYSFTFSSDDIGIEAGKGKPTGFETWDEHPGERFGESLHIALSRKTEEEAVRYLSSQESAYIVENYLFCADSVTLEDGTELQIIDSGYFALDDSHYMGYREYLLPDGYQAGDEVRFVITMMGTTSVFYQDETGVYANDIFQRECMVSVIASASVSQSLNTYSSVVKTGEYEALAELYISDVDISGCVKITGPEEWIKAWEPCDDEEEFERRWNGSDFVKDYKLIVNGEFECTGYMLGVFRRDETSYTLDLRYDLPEGEIDSLELIPIRRQSGETPEESIAVQCGEPQP